MEALRACLRSPSFVLRGVELVFGIIAFAPIAEFSGYSRVDFAIVCGVFTMLASLAFMACHLRNVKMVGSVPLAVPCLVVDGVMFIFWLACAASLSDMLSWFYGYSGSYKSRLQASVAFSWLSWFLFIGSCVLDVLDLRKQGGSATAPAAAAAPAPGGKGEEKEAPAEPAAPASAAPSSVSEEAQAAAVPPEVATAV